MGALSASLHPLMSLDTRSILLVKKYVFVLIGLCLLELFNGTCFNGARTVLMGPLSATNGALSASQVFNGALSSSLLHHITTEK